jgi:hypothetical protein
MEGLKVNDRSIGSEFRIDHRVFWICRCSFVSSINLLPPLTSLLSSFAFTFTFRSSQVAALLLLHAPGSLVPCLPAIIALLQQFQVVFHPTVVPSIQSLPTTAEAQQQQSIPRPLSNYDYSERDHPTLRKISSP